MTNSLLLRFQDKDGRGPFRKGVTALWSDETGNSPPSVFVRFPQLNLILPRLRGDGMHIGCAVPGWDALDRYFTRAEQDRLDLLGYKVCRVPPAAIIVCSDQDEAVFAFSEPLKTLPIAPRPVTRTGRERRVKQ